jgi:hypothetical protein
MPEVTDMVTAYSCVADLTTNPDVGEGPIHQHRTSTVWRGQHTALLRRSSQLEVPRPDAGYTRPCARSVAIVFVVV